MMQKQTTPERIDGRIKSFLRLAGLWATPVYLPYTHFDARYRATYCLDNCAHAAREGVGTVVYGWMIWDAKRLKFTEAEFHSVLSRGGELVDITPRQDAEERILFVPDPSRTPVFEGSGWRTFSNIKSSGGIVIESSRPSIRGYDPLLH